MGIMDIFKGGNASTQAAAPAAAAPAAAAPAAAATPPAAGQQQQQQQQDSPMDAFKDMWQNEQKQGASQSPLALDQAKLSEVVGKANFASGLTPELVQKATSGDAEAFIEAMNLVSRQTFQQAITANSTLSQQAFDHYGTKQALELPNMVRSSMVRQDLASTPLFQHEATRPILSAIEQQLSAKYPQATAAEITQHAKTYLSEFAKIAAGEPAADPATQEKSKAGDFTDW